MQVRALLGVAAVAGLIGAGREPHRPSDPRPVPPPAADTARPAASDWLNLLPDGDAKQRFIRDCTGCHGWGEPYARRDGVPRGEAGWEAVIERMLGYAGPASSFRLIGADRDPAETAAWLATHLDPKEPVRARRPPAAPAEIREYLLPAAGDLPHDVAVERDGQVVITGMFTHQMYRLDPASGAVTTVTIPVPGANPRAVDLDERGDWWVVLGAPGRIARYRVADAAWDSWDVGMYAHSLAVAPDGRVWYDGHFTRDPPQIGWVAPGSSDVTAIDLPRHPTLSDDPTGPVPYEIRVAPDGTVWTGELSGDRLIAYHPASGATRVVPMPPGERGPRRFEIDAAGALWIPMYASGTLLRYEPAADRFERIALPITDAAPYVVKLDEARGAVWIGTGAADAVFRYHPAAGRFDTYLLPSRGALVRHIAIDPRDGSAWLAYGASPGIAARVARVRPAE